MVGIILLIDGHSDAIGGIGHLRDGIDDETVVLLSVVGGNHIETVADIEEGGKIVFFEPCEKYIGQFVDVLIERGDTFALYGKIVK